MKQLIEIQPFGAQLVQWGESQPFYVSPKRAAGVACVRGGQPVLFPQFADRGKLKKHGFLRDVLWQPVPVANDVLLPNNAEAQSVAFKKNIAFGEFPEWPHAATVELTVTATLDQLLQRLTVLNTGESTFSWTGGLHPYFALNDLLAAHVDGLSAVGYADRYDPASDHIAPEHLIWTEAACEKLFASAPSLRLHTGGQTLQLTTSGFDQWMIWNPGRQGADELADLPEGDWQKFVCIEPVCVDRPVALPPGARFEGRFEICALP